LGQNIRSKTSACETIMLFFPLSLGLENEDTVLYETFQPVKHNKFDTKQQNPCIAVTCHQNHH